MTKKTRLSDLHGPPIFRPEETEPIRVKEIIVNMCEAHRNIYAVTNYGNIWKWIGTNWVKDVDMSNYLEDI